MSVHCIVKVYSVYSDCMGSSILVGVLASPCCYRWTTIVDAELLVREFGSQLQCIYCGRTVCLQQSMSVLGQGGACTLGPPLIHHWAA